MGLVVCCLGCRDAKSSRFQRSSTPIPTPPYLFLIRWFVQEWRGLRLLLLLLMTLSSFGEPTNTCMSALKCTHKHVEIRLYAGCAEAKNRHVHVCMLWHTVTCMYTYIRASNSGQAQAICLIQALAYVHIQRHPHIYELAYMCDYAVHDYTFIHAKMHITYLNIFCFSLSSASTLFQCLSFNTVRVWTAAVICHVSLCHVIWAVRFLTQTDVCLF